MQLVLSVGGKVLDQVPLDKDLAKYDDYLQSLRRLLLTKNELSIIALQGEPTFYIEASSKVGGSTN